MQARVQRLVFGDWGRLVRDPIDLLRLSYVAGAVGFALAGNPEAVRVAAGAALVFLARSVDLPRTIDLMLCLGVGLEVWGQAFNLYDDLVWYDEVVHFTLPFLVAPLAYIVLNRLRLVPDLRREARRHHYLGIWLITFSVVAAFGGTLWEVYEYVSDELFGSNLSFGYADTIGDMACTAGGSALGGLFLVAWAERRWGTTRRRREHEPATAPAQAA